MTRLLAAIVSISIILSARPRAPEPLDPIHLEAVHAQHIAWLKQRAVLPAVGIYQDFRAVTAPEGAGPEALSTAIQNTGTRVVFSPKPGKGDALFLDGMLPAFPDDPAPALTPKQLRGVEGKFKLYPDEVYAVTRQVPGKTVSERELTAELRNSSVHVLARDRTEPEVRASLAQGRYYWAHDWMCDPEGFSFIAQTSIGAFDVGDTAPLLDTRFFIALPLPAKLKLFRDDMLVTEATNARLMFPAERQGDYRLEAWLTADGEDRLWIRSGTIRVGGAPTLEVPTGTVSGVNVRKDIAYGEGESRKLDLYLPADRTNFPMLVFLHGGTWRSGDRTIYAMIGNRFASAGIGVAIPGFEKPEDAAAAYAWVYRNAAEQGADPRRVYLAGHAAGAQAAALVALDGSYLSALEVPPSVIAGVVALSGLYDSGDTAPLRRIHSQAPPFLVAYSQWDYFGLPRQAREFAAALKKGFVGATLAYLPGKNHITEILDVWKDDDPTARAILDFVK